MEDYKYTLISYNTKTADGQSENHCFTAVFCCEASGTAIHVTW